MDKIYRLSYYNLSTKKEKAIKSSVAEAIKDLLIHHTQYVHLQEPFL